MTGAIEALARLREGNQRFISGETHLDPHFMRRTPDEIISGQEPIAVVLGCSDSRVPVEIIFDQSLGDLFVIRVAGNIVAASQIGSVEFAAEQFGVQLVVVMGHTHCGAVQATLEELMQPSPGQSRNLLSIVNRIRPSIEGLLATELRHNPAALEAAAVRSNVRIAANALRHGSAMLETLMLQDKLLIVGAEYSLASGQVEFFDGVP
jgi:carbonic anhydrase